MRARLYKYAHTVFMLSIVINRAEHARVTVNNKHKCMIVCNHKIVINIMSSDNNVVEPRFQTRYAIGQ